MDYIMPMHYPGALSDTAASVLRTVYLAIVWMPRPCDLNHDQLRALLALRNAGYIEYAAFGGYRIRANQYTVASVEKPTPPNDLARLAEAFAQAGIQPAKPLRVVESGAFKRTRTTAVSIAVTMPKGTRIPGSVWAMCEDGAYCNGEFFVVQLKSA